MNTKYLTSALLLGCLLLPALAVAQEADTACRAEVEGQEEQALRDDDDTATADLEPTKPKRAPALLQMEGQMLRLEGGVPGEKVAILAGLPGTPWTLPGGDLLHFLPLAVLAVGEVADDGSFSMEMKYEGPRIEPIMFLVQAVSLAEDGVLHSSSLFEMHFDGVGKFYGWAIVVQAEIQIPSTDDAIRADMLA